MMANQDPLLPFGEFVELQNNFHLRFVGEPGRHLMGDAYRKHCLAYQKCMKTHPKKFERLRSELQAMHNDCKTLFFGPKYLQKLYGAYTMMHPYAEKNLNLFR